VSKLGGQFGKSPPLLIKVASWRKVSGTLFLPNAAGGGSRGFPEGFDASVPVSARGV